ncbi:MAG: hypothetical protein A2V66_07965 [Ignavibacteria bacterium RBG_13_36_8]|nr:MAG: hypothetical protein A2V66_07965 [Ignavibacteria bacterium RBG_13_36_8]
MKNLEILKSNQDIFFKFMKAKYPLFYNSNLFFRDMLYTIRSFFEKKNSSISYSSAEKLATEFINYLVEKGDLIKLDDNSWKVNFLIEKPVIENTEA